MNVTRINNPDLPPAEIRRSVRKLKQLQHSKIVITDYQKKHGHNEGSERIFDYLDKEIDKLKKKLGVQQ